MGILKFALGAAAPLAMFAGSPAVAQDGNDAAQVMARAFTAEPLSAEQESRLPAAEQVVARIFPPGTYMKMMDQSMQPMMDAIMAQVGSLPIADLMRMTGIDEGELAQLGDGTLDEMMAILDPAHEERQKLVTSTTLEWMGRLMDRMEPSFRAGLARAYAVRFPESDLRELNAFFATPAGSRYAEESMLIMMDPQVMVAMSEMMPAMMDTMPQMMAEMQRKMESLPKARNIEDLSSEEKAQLAKLLGVDPASLN